MNEWTIFHVAPNVDTSFSRFVTMHAFDRRMDRRTGISLMAISCVALHAVAG